MITNDSKYDGSSKFIKKNNNKRNAVWKYNLCIYKVDHSLKL